MNKLLPALLLLITSFSASAQNNLISGHIRLDSAKGRMHDTFMVWLIKFDSATNVLSAVDSQLIPNYYLHVYDIPYGFNNKPSGTYRVKAAWGPYGPTLVNGVMPTYHDSSIMWNQAALIMHTGGTSTGNDIFIRYGNVPAGPGFIAGNVNQGANKGTAGGIAGMNVYLLNAQAKPIAVSVTDNTGAYSFSNIPTGTYEVHPENLGDVTTAASVTITASEATFNDIHFERSNTDKTIKPKTTGIYGISASMQNALIYPNPAKSRVNINWTKLSGETANITITDIRGKKVYSSQSTMSNNTVISVQNLQPGCYFLSITTDNTHNTKKLVIE